jgi:heptosyltransferase-2
MEESCVTEKLAVFMPSWVGDAVMATPTLRALHQHFNRGAVGDGSLVGVMQPAVSQLLSGAPWFSEQILFDKRSWTGRLRLAMRLRAAGVDTVLLLTNSLWTAVVARLAGVPRRIGYTRDGRGMLLTERVPALRTGTQYAPVPAIDYYLRLADRMGCDARDRRMQLHVAPEDFESADRLWTQIGFSPGRPTVVINSSGAWGAAKLWPAGQVEQLARRIVENHPYQVLLHCGPAERTAANEIADRIGHPRVQSMGRAVELPLALSKAVLARASVVVSTDSGPRHIAVALDRPVIGLYGPTDPAWTTTYNQPEVALGVKNLACRGCWQKSCPLVHNRCMRDLGVETVYGAVVGAMHQGQRWLAA